MFSPDADLFFFSPRSTMKPPSWFGVLYLLRRDIDLCMGIDPNTGKPQNHFQALWPGAMATLAGIDLLGKFLAGDDSIGKVGDRFKDFVVRYFSTTSTSDREVVYQLRNALLHSFGLYSLSKGQVNRFFLTANASGPLVTFTKPDKYAIDLRVLHRGFESAVQQYQVDVDKDVGLQANFSAMFTNYGRVYIG